MGTSAQLPGSVVDLDCSLLDLELVRRLAPRFGCGTLRLVAQRLEEQRAAIDDPHALASTFLDIVRGDPLSEAEAGIVASALRTFATAEVGQ